MNIDTQQSRVDAAKSQWQENQRRLSRILSTYQVKDVGQDGMTEVLGRSVTVIEARMFERLSLWEKAMYGRIHQDAEARMKENFPIPEGEPTGNVGGQRDAFRHAYWSARLAQRFGDEWAYQFTTAHEAKPDNKASEEAMDLYNNEVGIRIALEHPHADGDELAELIIEEMNSGGLLVLDENANPMRSGSDAPTWDGGDVPSDPIPGVRPVPKGDAQVEPLGE